MEKHSSKTLQNNGKTPYYIQLIEKESPLTDLVMITGKNKKLLHVLIENGLDEPKFREILYDLSDYDSVSVGVENITRPFRELDIKKFNYATRWLSKKINDEDFEPWHNEMKLIREGIKLTVKNLNSKKQKAKSQRQMEGWKVVQLVELIEPIIDQINKEAGTKLYKKVDIYRLISQLWFATEGQSRPRWTITEIRKMYRNNTIRRS